MSSLAVTASSRPLRRELGPTAWAVLEDLALDAVSDATGRLVATSNVRRLAANLGVSKDAIARALRRLLACGAIVRLPAPRQAGRTFGPIAYLVCTGTYWYLSATPELLAQAARRVEHHRGVSQ